MHPYVFHNEAGPISEQDILSSLSGSLLYGEVYSACVTASSSGNTPEFLPSSWFVISSKVPGLLCPPVQAHCVVSATHLLHVVSVVWCTEEMLPLNIWPTISSQDAKKSCASVSITSKAAQVSAVCISP